MSARDRPIKLEIFCGYAPTSVQSNADKQAKKANKWIEENFESIDLESVDVHSTAAGTDSTGYSIITVVIKYYQKTQNMEEAC